MSLHFRVVVAFATLCAGFAYGLDSRVMLLLKRVLVVAALDWLGPDGRQATHADATWSYSTGWFASFRRHVGICIATTPFLPRTPPCARRWRRGQGR